MNEIKIEVVDRNLTPSERRNVDIEQLKILYRESNWWSEDNDASDPDLINKIISGSFCFVIATLNERIIGMGRAISDGISDAYIQDMAVLPEFRGNGIGVLIMDELIRFLQEKKVNWITLISEPKAVSFYERYGFSLMKDYVPFTLK